MTKPFYPLERQLKKIENFDVMKSPDHPLKLFHYIRTIWHWPDWGYYEHWGFNFIRKKVFKIECHTGGWSGNECIIQALEKNKWVWAFFWEKSVRGGHFYFEIDKSYFKKEKGDLPSQPASSARP